MNKIVPLGGAHKSAQSLLAEVMNDQNVQRVVLVTFKEDGATGLAHFQCTRQEMAWASLLISNAAIER
jgi:hypothetical protein